MHLDKFVELVSDITKCYFSSVLWLSVPKFLCFNLNQLKIELVTPMWKVSNFVLLQTLRVWQL